MFYSHWKEYRNFYVKISVFEMPTFSYCEYDFFRNNNIFVMLAIAFPLNYCTGSGWVESTFLTAAHPMLYLGFVTKPVLIIHQCSAVAWVVLAQCQGVVD